MPNYNFRNNETSEEIEVFMKISELDQWKEDNPGWTQFLTAAPRTVSGVGSNLKVDDGFREVISKVKQTYTVNNIKDY
jgi:hypothetical protein